MNLYRNKDYGGIYRILNKKGGITLCRFFDSNMTYYCRNFKELEYCFTKINTKEAKKIIASKYIHKESQQEYRLKAYATCKDRDTEVVIYADKEGKLYTREKSEFLDKFTNEMKT